MKLSLILCSRNDNYQGNSRWRLQSTLNYVGARVAELGRGADVEVIVADWGSEVPLGDTIPLTPEAAQIVSFLWIPPALARARQKDSPFPEVLALNAALRRASGDFVGRIDQDTLVGARFLRLFFDLLDGRVALEGGTAVETALLFANRRSVPYRFVELAPAAQDLDRFISRFGSKLKVWQQNAATGHVFWTSYVGIWLAHRTLWEKAGGYDERMIYYNWMETDMIWRLRPHHAVVDLGRLTDQDFYHLEHNHPVTYSRSGRPHGRNNPNVDLAARPSTLNPSGDDWGLKDVALPLRRGTRKQDLHDSTLAWPFLLGSLGLSMAVDRAMVVTLAQARRLRRYHPRKSVPEALGRTGLLGATRRLRLRSRLLSDPDLRRMRREDSDRFFQFSREGTGAIRAIPGAPTGRTALLVSTRCPTIEGELCLIKALQLAGLTPVVLLEDERRALRPFYELAGVAVRLWSEFITSRTCRRAAAATVNRCASIDALMNHQVDGIRVGMIAVCTALRQRRVGVLDLAQPAVRDLLTQTLAASMCATLEAHSILAAVKPDVVLTPPEYTPHAELFERCLAAGIDTIAHDHSHRFDAVVLKRYTTLNRDRHLTTLSEESWKKVRALDWTATRAAELNGEMTASYKAGDWYGTRWASNAPTSPVEVKRMLGLNGDRPVAAIFPHMLWDAPVMWGQPVFPTYQDWLVETVRAAYRNSRVNWVVKIHPAHVRKQVPGGAGGINEPAEVTVLREALGPFPAHVKCLLPDTPLSTLSLLSAVDYCFTVRGTVGVEAARLGVPVFTAGPARYSGLGFTVDSQSQEEYLERLAGLQETPPLPAAARQLAERFAYGLFVLRPLTISSISRDPAASDRVRINVRSEDEWRTASDVSALARWFAARDEDFLHPV